MKYDARVLLATVVNNILIGICASVWIVSAVYLYTVDSVSTSDGSPLSKSGVSTGFKMLWVFNIFGFIWIVSFIRSLRNFVVFTLIGLEKNGMFGGFVIIFKPYWWALRFHMGSIALGSFLLPFMWIIRIPLQYVCKHILSINIQTLCEITISGKSFFKAAEDCEENKEVYEGHSKRFLSGTVNFLMIFANLSIVGMTLCIAMLIIRYNDYINENLTSPFWPLFVNIL